MVVRALDEGYFKYTPGSANNSTSGAFGAFASSPDLKAATPSKESKRRGWGMGRSTGKHANKAGEKVEIVEDNPGREGLEGVGVGAVNIYLVVFVDGIISVSPSVIYGLDIVLK